MSPERRCEDGFDIRAVFARELHRGRDRPTSQWHLDEMAVTLASRQFWLWRAADGEGEVLDLCSNDAGTRIGSEGAVTRTQIGRAQSGGPSSGLGRGGGFPCPERFVSKDAEREFTSTDTTTRAEDATLQIARISPALPVDSRRGLQHLQRPASSHIPSHAPHPPNGSFPDVASRHRRLSPNWAFQSSSGQIQFA